MAKDECGRTGIGGRDGKSDLLGDRIAIGSQRFSGGGDDSELSMSRRVWIPQPRVAMLEDRVAEDEV